MSGPTTVRTQMSLHLVVPGAASLPVRADLAYDPADPYAVQVAFHTGTGNHSDRVAWTFARSLLSDGLVSPAGDGDVRVWPSRTSGAPVVCLSLSSPSGKALFEVPQAELAAFVRQVDATVPHGQESDHVDLDAELALLLWAQPGT